MQKIENILNTKSHFLVVMPRNHSPRAVGPTPFMALMVGLLARFSMEGKSRRDCKQHLEVEAKEREREIKQYHPVL